MKRIKKSARKRVRTGNPGKGRQKKVSTITCKRCGRGVKKRHLSSHEKHCRDEYLHRISRANTRMLPRERLPVSSTIAGSGELLESGILGLLVGDGFMSDPRERLRRTTAGLFADDEPSQVLQTIRLGSGVELIISKKK